MNIALMKIPVIISFAVFSLSVVADNGVSVFLMPCPDCGKTVPKRALTMLGEQDEAFCLSLTLDERLRVIEELNCQGRIMAGYSASSPMDRTIARICVLSAL